MQSFIYMRLLKYVESGLLMMFSFLAFGQEGELDLKSRFQLSINKASDKIILDGKLDEKSWINAEVGTDFWQKQPYFAEHADPKTEVRVTYDDDYFYYSAVCYQKDNIVIQSLKRDEFWDNDAIAIVLDPLKYKNKFLSFWSNCKRKSI